MKYYPSRRQNNFGLGWFDSEFEDFFHPFFGVEKSAMKTDIREEGDNYILEVDMPGYDKKDVNLSLENGYLTVSAQSSNAKETKDENKNYLRRERSFGSCSRSFYVGDVDEKQIAASYDNGILNVSFPKNCEQLQNKKQIEIK